MASCHAGIRFGVCYRVLCFWCEACAGCSELAGVPLQGCRCDPSVITIVQGQNINTNSLKTRAGPPPPPICMLLRCTMTHVESVSSMQAGFSELLL